MNSVLPHSVIVNTDWIIILILTATHDVSPAGDPARRPFLVDAVGRCQTHGSGVVVELNWWGQFQQGYVVIESCVEVERMLDDLRHCPGLLVTIQAFLSLTSEVNHQTRSGDTEKSNMMTCEWCKQQQICWYLEIWFILSLLLLLFYLLVSFIGVHSL